MREPGEETESEDYAEDIGGGEVAGESDEEGADGPCEDADAVDAFGAEAIEKATGGKLAEYVGPTEA